MIRVFRTVVAGAAALAVTVALAGCSAGSTGTSGGSVGSSGAPAGEPIKIMAFGSLSSPPYPLPQLVTGAEAAVNRVNSEGGINGRPLELITCDDQGNANGTTACAQQAVTDDVTAVVGQFTLFGDAFVGVTDKAGIPLVFTAAVSQLEVTSANSFPVVGAVPPSLAILSSFADQGCETTVIVASDNAQSRNTYGSFTEPWAVKHGFKTVFVTYAPDTSDFSSVAAQIADAGDCVQFNGGAPDTSAIMRALKQSGASINHQAVLSTIAMPEASLEELGADVEGLQLFSPNKLPSSQDESVLKAQQDMQAVDSGAVVDMISLNSYAGVQAFAQAASKLDDVTKEGIAKQLADPSTTIETGIFPPINFASQMGFFEATPRVAGSFFYGYIAKDGHWVPNGDVTTDLAKLQN